MFYKEHKGRFEEIKTTLKSLGVGDVFSLTDIKVENDYDDVETLIKTADKLIKDCDVLIVEGSRASAGLGYDIATAVTMKKPILVLIDPSFQKGMDTPHPMRLNSKYITYVNYEQSNISEVVNTFVLEARKKLDTKFILIISPEIDRYLEWASSKKRMHKAQIVREAVENVMKQDAEWIEKQEH